MKCIFEDLEKKGIEFDDLEDGELFLAPDGDLCMKVENDTTPTAVVMQTGYMRELGSWEELVIPVPNYKLIVQL